MFKNSNWVATFPYSTTIEGSPDKEEIEDIKKKTSYGITIEGSPEDLTNFYKLVLTKISTKDLVEELKKREGVVATEINPEEMFRITTVDFNGNVKHKNGVTSPCAILEIFD